MSASSKNIRFLARCDYGGRPDGVQVAKAIQSCDVFVDSEGLMYLTDTNAGLYILQYEGN
ncbi:MAG: hypothetical protein HY244_09615 [Rhizobiales bacterium]|nr:hypothetical protein [Hyphomicrobiales bacterium]